jgi:hypothetical protein
MALCHRECLVRNLLLSVLPAHLTKLRLVSTFSSSIRKSTMSKLAKDSIESHGYTYSPLHSVHDKRSCAADAETTEEHSSSFALVGTTGNAESAWSCWPLRLIKEGL